MCLVIHPKTSGKFAKQIIRSVLMPQTQEQLSQCPLLDPGGHQGTNHVFPERVVVLALQEVMGQYMAKWEGQAQCECERPLTPRYSRKARSFTGNESLFSQQMCKRRRRTSYGTEWHKVMQASFRSDPLSSSTLSKGREL